MIRKWGQIDGFSGADFRMRFAMRNGVHVEVWRFPYKLVPPMARYTANIAFKGTQTNHINAETRRELFKHLRLEIALLSNPEFQKTHARLHPKQTFGSLLKDHFHDALKYAINQQPLLKRIKNEHPTWSSVVTPVPCGPTDTTAPVAKPATATRSRKRSTRTSRAIRD